MLVVKSKIKDIADCNVSSDFAEELNKQVEALVKRACERAKGNKRGTVMAKDL